MRLFFTSKNTAVVSGTFSFTGFSIEPANWLPNFFMAGRKFQDLTGQRFNRLLVVSHHGLGKRGNYWVCKCDCGNEKITNTYSLRSNHCRSCGCIQKEHTRNLGFKNATHGCNRVGNTTPEYRTWSSMITRCTNPKNKSFKDYGGRGILICDRWLNSFEAFLEDMGCRPDKFHSIDRIRYNGNYEPENCRWATKKDQNRNTRQNHYITYNGKTQCIADWADEFGMIPTAIYKHLVRCKFDMAKTLERIEWREKNPYRSTDKSVYVHKRKETSASIPQ